MSFYLSLPPGLVKSMRLFIAVLVTSSFFDLFPAFMCPVFGIIFVFLSKWSNIPVEEATPGWCEVPGCKKSFTYWIIAMGVLSILASTGRVGNVLVALRCVEVRDKSLS